MTCWLPLDVWLVRKIGMPIQPELGMGALAEGAALLLRAPSVARATLLGGTTSLLLLCVFTIVNVAVLVLRRDPVDHKHFRAPTALPVVRG